MVIIIRHEMLIVAKSVIKWKSRKKHHEEHEGHSNHYYTNKKYKTI